MMARVATIVLWLLVADATPPVGPGHPSIS
jgi:hypothetical protein